MIRRPWGGSITLSNAHVQDKQKTRTGRAKQQHRPQEDHCASRHSTREEGDDSFPSPPALPQVSRRRCRTLIQCRRSHPVRPSWSFLLDLNLSGQQRRRVSMLGHSWPSSFDESCLGLLTKCKISQETILESGPSLRECKSLNSPGLWRSTDPHTVGVYAQVAPRAGTHPRPTRGTFGGKGNWSGMRFSALPLIPAPQTALDPSP